VGQEPIELNYESQPPQPRPSRWWLALRIPLALFFTYAGLVYVWNAIVVPDRAVGFRIFGVALGIVALACAFAAIRAPVLPSHRKRKA
jgi:hypothetical protein